MRRVLVVGVGGIGGTVAGRLAEAAEVHVYSRNPAIREALNTHGLQLTGHGGDKVARAQVLAELPAAGSFDYVFLATQPPQMVDAARSVAHLIPDGTLVALQNGLPERHLAPVVGEDKVIGVVVGWGASMRAPGVFERTTAGSFTLDAEARCDDLAQLLEAVAPAKRSQNFVGSRWAKLSLNSAISTLATIGGKSLGDLLIYQFGRRLGLEVFGEAAAVTAAEGIKMEKLSGALDMNWIALAEQERARRVSASVFAKHAVLIGVGMRYRKLRSSMLAALERGREPAVDFVNGEVVALGEKHGIPTPVNSAAVAAIHAIHRGEKVTGVDTLRQLYAETR